MPAKIERNVCKKHNTEKYRDNSGDWRCTFCKREKEKRYRESNKDKIASYFQKEKERYKKLHKANYEKRREENIKGAIKRFEKRFYGFDATLYVTGKCCERCGITNEQHIAKFKSRLNIHHKDGQGYNLSQRGLKPNNNPENLMIVCSSCHCKIHKTKSTCPDADKFRKGK